MKNTEIAGTWVLLIVSPIIVFGCGWLGGLILKLLIGTAVTNGLNTLFGTTRFSPDLIPIVCGALATVGSYFKSSNTSSSK